MSTTKFTLGRSELEVRGATFPGRLVALASERGHKHVALQEKRYGIWQTHTWLEYEQRVRWFANALDDLGVGHSDVIAVLSDNRPEWLIAELAAQVVGAAVVGIYPSSTAEEIVHVLRVADARLVVAEDQEQVDKLVEVRARFEALQTVIYVKPRGLEDYAEEWLNRFEDVESAGMERDLNRPGWFTERINELSPDDVAIVCTTSGTTAAPKLAQLTHANLLAMGERFLGVERIDHDARYVSFLPFAWVGEQMLAVACGLQAGFTLSFPEDPETQQADLREIGPDLMFSPPTIWEGFVSQAQVGLGEADWLKRSVFSWGYRVGARHSHRKTRGQHPRLVDRLLYPIAEQVALRPMRERLGLTRLRRGYTGGAPLGPDVFSFFHAIGINLKQIYGQTEISGIAVAHRDSNVRSHTVGVCLPDTELSISKGGEILLRSPAVFRGYLGDSGATADVLDGDGWLHTGDAGYVDEETGHLVVIDRLKEVHTTTDGTQFSPAFIENKLKFSRYVDQAVVYTSTGGREITSLLTIDFEATAAWAEKAKLSFTTFTDLSQKPHVLDLLSSEVSAANAELPPAVRVTRFAVLHKPLDPDDDEVTRTRKVRRDIVLERYAKLFKALDSYEEQVEISNRVVYQDGRSVNQVTTLKICTVTKSRDKETATAIHGFLGRF